MTTKQRNQSTGCFHAARPLAVVMPIVALLVAAPAHAQTGPIVLTPTVGVTPPLTIVTVNDGPGQQYDPHVSGDLVSYSDGISPTSVRYFRFSTSADAVIPVGDSFTDLLSDVSGNRITFSRILSDRSAAMLWDTNTWTLTEADAHTGTNRLGTAIGGNTMAWVDYVVGSGTGDIVAYDIAAGVARRLSYSDESDLSMNVSPDGKTIVWETCATLFLCDVSTAVWDTIAGLWNVTTLATPDSEAHPDTDGTWIAYDSSVGQDIYFRPVTGGPARQLSLAGAQSDPSISSGVISFNGTDGSDGSLDDIFVYVLATNTLYRITSTPTVGEDLSDVHVLPNGDIRLVWNAADGPGGERNVYATTFRVPTSLTHQVCLLYDPLKTRKSGAGYPIKVQLCDASGNNLSSPSIALHAVSVTRSSTSAPGPLDDTGNANPDFDFRYDVDLAGYSFNLSTRGLSTGTYTLNFTVGGNPTVYSVPFAIK